MGIMDKTELLYHNWVPRNPDRSSRQRAVGHPSRPRQLCMHLKCLSICVTCARSDEVLDRVGMRDTSFMVQRSKMAHLAGYYRLMKEKVELCNA